MTVGRRGLDEWDLPWPRPLVPAYRETAVGGWRLERLPLVPQLGYFQEVGGSAEQWLLHTGDQCWMTLSQLEVESHAPHLAAAHGQVVLMGAGIGLALYNVLRSPAVEAVTLVEIDAAVLELLEAAAGFSRWSGAEKLTTVIGDAFEFRPRGAVDYLFVDIWPMTGDRRAPADVQRLQRQVRAAALSWWSQEIHFLRWLAPRDPGLRPTPERFAAWADELELPLVPSSEQYLEGIAALARGTFFDRYRRHPEHW